MRTLTPTEPPARIDSRLARRRFFRWLLAEGVNFHPDTPFDDYVDRSGARCFDDATAARLDRLMVEACEFDPFVYDEGLFLLRRALWGPGLAALH